MGKIVKARGADDAGALSFVHISQLNIEKNTKYLNEKQVLVAYDVGHDLMVTPRFLTFKEGHHD